jgi:uncharacterized protein (DUF2062 family)
MPRKFFRRVSAGYLPKGPKRPGYLRPFGVLLDHPVLFAINRRSVAGAVWVGLLVGLLPLPAQTLIALLLAMLLRVNLPIAALMVWVTNPISMVPIFYTEYRLGTLILNTPLKNFEIELSWDWLSSEFVTFWKPLLLGSFITAAIIASLGYVAVSVTWRLIVSYRYKKRRIRNNLQ